MRRSTMTRTLEKAPDIQPVILCGGSGSRLWPLSRAALPKQFIKLVTERSLLQDTVGWVPASEGYRAPMIVSNQEFRFLVSSQMGEIDVQPSAIVLEPQSRNTAAAIALAALVQAEEDADACLLVLPSDHILADKPAFLDAVHKAHRAASAGALVTFGMPALRPETGYGYIHQGAPYVHAAGCFGVDCFIEKPDAERARIFVREGRYHWNSGIFMFTARRYLEELRRFKPDILEACERAFAEGRREGLCIVPDAGAFAAAENLSVDYAVMEHTDHAVVVVADFEWSDVGSWTALADLGPEDADGNVVDGDALIEDCRGTFVKSSGRLIAAVGLEDHVIVETGDSVLVAPKDRVQEVKKVVERLRDQGRDEATLHAKVHRPWGTYESVHQGARHQVKHIVVNPGGKLSSQYHHHRAEHWTIVAGVAQVTLNGKPFMLGENETVFIPVGMTHRLYNPGDEPLHLIEVQYGDYLGEDDIVRLDDVYGRVAEAEPATEAACQTAAE